MIKPQWSSRVSVIETFFWGLQWSLVRSLSSLQEKENMSFSPEKNRGPWRLEHFSVGWGRGNIPWLELPFAHTSATTPLPCGPLPCALLSSSIRSPPRPPCLHGPSSPAAAVSPHSLPSPTLSDDPLLAFQNRHRQKIDHRPLDFGTKKMNNIEYWTI